LLERRLPATPEGRAELAAEIACLAEIRRDLLAQQERAGRRRNGLKAVSNHHELAAIDEESRRLWQALAQVELAPGSQIVALGSEVTVMLGRQTRRFKISGPIAANPRLGWLSFESPIARAVLGREVGDEVELIGKGSRRKVRIVATR
jgi:transcription elongation GreA/GreB family factor